jgi:hypothetical protein
VQQKRLLMVGALALVLGAIVRISATPVAAGATFLRDFTGWSTPSSAKNLYQWTPLWSASAPQLAEMTLAADGGSVAWMDKGGVIRRVLGDTGKLAWATPPYTGLNHIAVSNRGVVVAFYQGEGKRSAVRLLDPNVGAGRTSLFPLDGAIKTVKVTSDGDEVIFGMSSSLAYVVPMQNNAAWSGKPVELPNIPSAIDTATDEDGHSTVVCGTQHGDLVAWTMQDGHIANWQDSRETPRPVSEVKVSKNGSTAAVISTDSEHSNRYHLAVWDVASGQRLWAEDFEGFTPRVLLSENGRFIALNYARLPVRPTPTGEPMERKVTLFDRKGQRLFSERGSVSFSPELLAISPDGGCLTVRDLTGNLWTWDNRGRTIARLRPPHDLNGKPLNLKRALATPEGSALLLHYASAEGNDHLSLYRFSSSTP